MTYRYHTPRCEHRFAIGQNLCPVCPPVAASAPARTPHQRSPDRRGRGAAIAARNRQWADRVLGGDTIDAIAEESGYHPTTVQQAVNALGVATGGRVRA